MADMTDEQMADFLGFGDDPRRIEAVQKLPPQQRALFERMASLDTEVELWRAGLGPKPESVLMDFPRKRDGDEIDLRQKGE